MRRVATVTRIAAMSPTTVPTATVADALVDATAPVEATTSGSPAVFLADLLAVFPLFDPLDPLDPPFFPFFPFFPMVGDSVGASVGDWVVGESVGDWVGESVGGSKYDSSHRFKMVQK